MINKAKKTKALLFLTLTFIISLLLAIVLTPFSSRIRTFANAKVDNSGVILYNENEFTVTEDFAPVVEAVMTNGSSKSPIYSLNGMKTRLDEGKSGLLITSKQTGKDVEGKGFSFANEMQGDFEMDFRVFSQKSLVTNTKEIGFAQGNLTAWEDDRANPYMDIRRMTIKITSITDPTKAFNVILYSGQSYKYNFEVCARVQIEGETFQDGGLPGYGLNDGALPGGYAYATGIYGTTFSNANNKCQETYSTTIKFDVDKMCVYGVSRQDSLQYVASAGNIGVDHWEWDTLIRNIGTNNNKDDNTGESLQGSSIKTLSSKDFKGGYTVSVSIDSMTSNTTPLTIASPSGTTRHEVYNWDNGSNAGIVTENVVGYENGYDRYANIVIYSVNGQDFSKKEDWIVEEKTNAVIPFSNEKGITMIRELWNEKFSAKYTTQVKYGNEKGSTEFTTTEHPLVIRLTNGDLYGQYGGNKFTTKVYYEGAETLYQMSVMQISTGHTMSSTVNVESGKWNEIEFWGANNTSDGRSWNFDLNDYYIVIQKKSFGETDSEEDDISWCANPGDKFYFSDVRCDINNNYAMGDFLRIKSTAKNIQAEGNSFGLNNESYKMNDNSYVLGVAALSKQYMPYGEAVDNYTYADRYLSNGVKGLGGDCYEWDPYSDVLEYGITYRSTIDPNQAFTVYLQNRSGKRKIVSSRVYVEGETFRNSNGDKGFAIANMAAYDAATGMTHGAASGTMGYSGNTTNNGYYGMADRASYIKFDPTTMQVYSYQYNWVLIRDLSTRQYGAGTKNGDFTWTGSDSVIKTLDKNAFRDENGNDTFTMEITVSKMNTEWNKGRSTIYHVRDGVLESISTNLTRHEMAGPGEVLENGYDRECIIDIYSMYQSQGQTLTSDSVNKDKYQDDYTTTYSWIDSRSLVDVGYKSVITLTAPTTVTMFGKTSYVGTATYVNEDGTDSGIVTFANGTGSFNPTGAGVYTFTINGASKAIKVGYVLTYDGGYDIIVDGEVDLSNYKVASDSSTFIGWTIDGQDGVYSSDYKFEIDKDTTVEAYFVDLRMLDDASIRLDKEKPGLRFGAVISKRDYDKLKASLVGVKFEYDVSGGAKEFKTITKEIKEENIFHKTETGEYYFYVSIVNFAYEKYGMDFRATVKVSFTTKDGVNVTYYAKQSDDAWRNVRETAKALIESETEYTSEQKQILNGYATFDYVKTLKSYPGIIGHCQNVVADDKGYMYFSYGKTVDKIDIMTGERVGKINFFSDHENNHGGVISDVHGGTIGYYDGYIYVPLMRDGRSMYSGHYEKYLKMMNAFLLRMPAENLEGELSTCIDDGTAEELGVEVAYVGAPFVELSSQQYDPTDSNSWRVCGKFGCSNMIDAITFGSKMGGEDDGKTYMTIAVATNASAANSYTDGSGNVVTTANRGDADYAPFIQFDVENIEKWNWLDLHDLINNEKDDEKLAELFVGGPTKADNMAFFLSGTLEWGPQGVAYDKYLDVYILGTYGIMDKKSGEYTDFRSFVVDPRSAPSKTDLKGLNGEQGYVMKAKFGLEGKHGVKGYYISEAMWDLGLATLGNGYYYVMGSNGTNNDSSAGAIGAFMELELYKFGLTKDNYLTAGTMFEKVA